MIGYPGNYVIQVIFFKRSILLQFDEFSSIVNCRASCCVFGRKCIWI